MGCDAQLDDLQRFLSEKLGRIVTLMRFSHVDAKSVFKMIYPVRVRTTSPGNSATQVCRS